MRRHLHGVKASALRMRGGLLAHSARHRIARGHPRQAMVGHIAGCQGQRHEHGGEAFKPASNDPESHDRIIPRRVGISHDRLDRVSREARCKWYNQGWESTSLWRHLVSATQGSSDATTVRDPVCGMVIKISDAAETIEHAGQKYYFCSKSCAAKFRADPNRYAKR